MSTPRSQITRIKPHYHWFSQKGHDGVVKIILGWGNANSDTADRGRQVSLPQSAEHEDEPVFRTVQGPYRDGGDDAKKAGGNTTGRDRYPWSGPGQRTQGVTGLGGTAGPGTLGLSRDGKTHGTVAV